MPLYDLTEPEIAKLMQAFADVIAQGLSDIAGEAEPMFALVIFDNPKIVRFVSSVERPGLADSLRELARKLDAEETMNKELENGGDYSIGDWAS